MTVADFTKGVRKWIPVVAMHLGIALGYIVAAQLGFRVATVHPVVASVWPPAGLALAVLLLGGLRLWPGIFMGAIVANAIKDIPLPAATVIGVGNTLAAMLAAFALRRVDFRIGLQRLRDALALLGLGALCAPVVAATIGTLSLYIAGAVPADHLASVWYNWWSGDAIGVMVVAPLVVAWMHGRLPEPTGRRVAEIALLGASLLTVTVVLVRVLQSYEHAVFPLVGWAAIRYGQRGASIAAALVASVAMWQTVQGFGPFLSSGNDGLWRLQLFLALLAIGSLVIGAMATAQVRMEEAHAQDEEKLRRTTQLLSTLIDAAPLAILAVDPKGCVRSWNRAAEQMFGWPEAEVMGQTVPFVPPQALQAFRASLRRVLDGEALTGLQVRRNRRDGITLDLRICAAPTRAPDGTIDGVIAIAEDVTERKSLGEQLKQAQKMEAIGELTGGISHDFNNILTVVITNAALLADQIGLDRADMRGEVTDLQRAALRGAELVRKLMTFSRRRDLELSPVNLADVLTEMERALRRLLPKSVEVSSQIDNAGPLTIQGDVGAIEQILFNLATNGRDAMPDGGTLRLAVYRAWLDKEHRRTHGWGTSGEYIVLAVSDTGCGMSPETRARVFEPFFTTKEASKGTGLGMSMVYGLMKQHNGYISLYSEPGSGTTFRLYFPAATAGTQASAALANAAAPIGGTERILIVDDDDGIRRSAARVLKRSGYATEEAADGDKAMALLGGAENPFDLVLTDLVMPHMGGLTLYEQVQAHGNGTRVLLMSGYTAEDVRALNGAQPGLRFLHKPWTVTDLLRRVRGILDEPASQPNRSL
jgi:PAS domain S-box-containing protein